MIGEIDGIEPGTLFKGRKELHDAGIHCGLMVGIAAKGGESIVLSGGYNDDEDEGDVIIYTGEGGRDSATGRQVANQTLTRGNLALFDHFRDGNPIRVTRGYKAGPPHAPPIGYRYDGLHRIEHCWQETGTDGFLIWRYKLVKIPSSDRISTLTTPLVPEGNTSPTRSTVYTTRVVRNSGVGNYVKELYNYRCQISGIALDTPHGPYAEACHVRPVGKPHNGPDSVDNVLCLSPNMHVLFDLGAITLTDNLRIMGMDADLKIKPEHPVLIDHIRYHREHIYKG
jgi:putative restriction endonuclease